jgi:hypothetical protein
MKTKTFFMLWFLLGLGLAQLSAQDYPPPPQNPVVEGTKSVKWMGNYYISEWVECDGEFVALIEGNMTWQNISHFVNGVEVWEISKAKGEFTDYYTGEVYWVNETVKANIPRYGYITCSTNLKLKGNKSIHYIMKITIYPDWSWSYRIVCPGKD